MTDSFLRWCRTTCTVLLCAAGSWPAAAPAAADLVDLYGHALTHNPAFRAGEAGEAAALEAERAARGQLLPQVSAFADAQRIDERIQGTFFGFPDVDRSEGFTRYLYGVTVNQPLFRGDVFAGLDKAALGVAQARLAQEQRRAALLLEVAEAYFDALSAREVLELAQTRLKTVERQREQVRSRAEAGLLTEADRQLAESALQLARARQVEAQSALLVARSRLQAATGRREARIRSLTPGLSLVLLNPTDEGFWTSRARQAHPRVLQAELAAAIAEREATQQRRRHWPTLDLVGGYFELDNGGGLSGRRDEREVRIGARLALPIYAGGQIEAAAAAAGHRQTQAEAQLDEARDAAELEARTAYLQLLGGQQQLGALRQAVSAARLAESAARAGFDAGTRTSADVLAAVDQRFAAEVQLTGLSHRILLDSLRLKRAAGVLSGADLTELNRQLGPAVDLQ